MVVKKKRRRPAPEVSQLPLTWDELRAALGLTVAAGQAAVRLKCASGELRLPPGVWLVLDPLQAQRLSQEATEGDLLLGSRPCAGKARL